MNRLSAALFVTATLASGCKADVAVTAQGAAPLPAAKLSQDVKVLMGNPGQGDRFQVAVVAPPSAAQAWICLTPATERCDKGTAGALPLRPGKRVAGDMLQFDRANGLPTNQHLKLTAVAADAAGVMIGSAEASLWLTSAGVATPPEDATNPAGTPDSGGAATPALLPPPANLALPAPIPRAAVAYDFRGTTSRPSPTAGVVRLVVQSGTLKGKTALRLTGELKNLKHSSRAKPLDLEATADASGVVDVTVPGLEAETVYRIDNLSLAERGGGGGAEAVEDPYYLITGGATDLAQARRALALKALAEAYDWDHDNYDRKKDYASGGGWCDMFYSWSASGLFTIAFPDYAPDYFAQNGALLSDGSAKLVELAGKEAVHGDMIRYDVVFQGNHTFMALSYDQDTQRLWAVEGNYNNRVERSERKIEGGWHLGHLDASLIKK